MAKYYGTFTYPDASEVPHFGASASVPEALGEVVIAFEVLDEVLSTAISYLLRRTDEVGEAVTAGPTFRAKLDLLVSLFRLEAHSSRQFDRLQDLVAVCRQASDLRNQLVHSKWVGIWDSVDMARRKVTARAENGLRRHVERLTPAQVHSLALQCSYLAWCVDELLTVEFGRDYSLDVD